MTIHDAQVQVTCDGFPQCYEQEWLPTHWYTGGYNLSDDEAETMLESLGWITKDGKHYCSPECSASHTGKDK